MVVYKCKMCGGSLDIQEGSTVCECEYCGSMQTIPNLDSEKKLNLFSRANRLRAACEFDKAAGVYESIVTDFPEEAEAYWGLILCKYGIEYVDDPSTGMKIPTCHRSSFDSVMDDPNFDFVMEYSDAVSRTVYRKEAKEIERLRTGIIEVSSKEEPYDIFICYKETDAIGDRTIDSVIAQDVYDALTEKGYRVFFSRISLEDKLGQEYEPYIFAALNSAKIMLAFGTDYEYYNAVWVKNEWSRFLNLIAKGEKKTLIPCYKGIDAYDMPKEFARLQAQDMGKVGAVQDLIRGIEKILGPKNDTSNDIGYKQSNAEASKLVLRGKMALEDSDFKGAQRFFERALDINPADAHAYLGKFLAYYGLATLTNQCDKVYLLENDKEFKRAIQFADSALLKELKAFRELNELKLERLRIVDLFRKISEKKEKEEIACKEASERRIFEEKREKKKEELAELEEQLEAMKKGDYRLTFEEEKTLMSLKRDAEQAKEEYEKEAKILADMSEHTEKQRLETEISAKKSKMTSLGFFKGKEKRALQEQIIELESSYKKTVSMLETETRKVVQLQKAYYSAKRKVDVYPGDISCAAEKRLQERISTLVVLTAKMGDIVEFGRYETGNGTHPIRWRVLDDKKDLLLLTEEGIDCNKYNEEYTSVTWESCSLRKWLNDDFLNRAFTIEEARLIAKKRVQAQKNPKYTTDPGKGTIDQIFLLSVEETEKYFRTDEDRKCFPSQFALKQGVHTGTGGSSIWWLRSPGQYGDYASSVNDDGTVLYQGNMVCVRVCVRPALRIDFGQ